jgi:hypothetical protein
MKMPQRTVKALVAGLLLLGLIGLLAANLSVVGDLPAHMYTSDQREYLRFNARRRISQAAPTWNKVSSEGVVEPAILSEWHNRVRATLDARHEEQGGITAAVYDLDFHSEYHVAYPGPLSFTTIELTFPFPHNLDTLHQVQFLVDGEEPANVQYTVQAIRCPIDFVTGVERHISISYRAEGANSFAYALHHDRRSTVDVEIGVLGLKGSEVHQDSLPTSASEETGTGEIFVWDYPGLLATRDIGLSLPTDLSLAQRVAQLQDGFRVLAAMGPILVGLFLVALAVTLHWGGVRLGLVAYLLIGWCLALFYPMLTFLSGLLGVIAGAALPLVLVSGFVLGFLALAAGWKQTWRRAAWLLFIFLVVFSLGMLTPWRQLLLTSGCLLLVGTLMLLWGRRALAPEVEPPPATAPPPVPAEAEPLSRHCLYCGQALANDFSFCPGCSEDARQFRRCTGCGQEQYIPLDLETVHCTHCGHSLA